MNLEELENMRKKVRTVSIINIILTIIAVTFPNTAVKIVLIICSVILFIFVTNKRISEYKNAFKNIIVKASLEGIFSELEYAPENGIDREYVEKSELFKLGNTYSTNDLIHAKYKNVEFSQADISIKEHTVTKNSEGNEVSYTQQYFNGRLILFEFNKVLTAPVQVVGKNFNRGASDGIVGKITGGFINDDSWQKVTMESDEFNKNFKVLTADPLAAYYLLTPSIIEAVTHLSCVYKNNIALSFKDNTMFVAIYCKRDSLEPKILKGTTIANEQYKIQQDIKVITDFIDIMNLEKNIFDMGTNAV